MIQDLGRLRAFNLRSPIEVGNVEERLRIARLVGARRS